MSIKKSYFGTLSNGKIIDKYTFINKNNAQLSVVTYGATMIELFVPDKNGNLADVLVGLDNIDDLVEKSDYQGVIVGPYANRIGNASFSIDGVEYSLIKNEKNTTCLHSNGEFNTAVWDAEITNENSICFSYTSPDMQNGFPGNINVKVKYIFTDENEVKLEYEAVSDKKTVINLTNHAYFNLGGYDSGTILNHTLKINADTYTPVDAFSIPTGEIAEVKNTPFDFTTEKIVGDRIDDEFEQLEFTGGYDHNFCINSYNSSLIKAAEATDPVSGRILEVFTDLPGIQFYAGNFLNGTTGKNNKPMNKRCGFCLETQFYPDTPNKPEFPQCTYDANEIYKSTTVFKFSTK